MSEAPDRLRFTTAGASARGPRVGVQDGAAGAPDRFASLSALFPHVNFTSVGAIWPESAASSLDILIAAVDAASALEVDNAVRRLRAKIGAARVVVVMANADVATTRRLIREGAADVLPGPASEPAMAACLERLLVTLDDGRSDQRSGQVVAFLKAGGGVGATALATQCAATLARRDAGQVCLADFDLQFGAASLYLDLPDAMTIDDVLASGPGFAESPFASILARHRSGARVLAAPRDITPLEYLSAAQADTIIHGLKREFALTIVELPTVWTAWTNRLLQLANKLVVVTNLSVPHMHIVKRQQRLIAAQGLETQPLVLVCNALSSEQVSQVSLKAAERALGRKFDVVIPEDRRVMNAAINEGQTIASVRRGTKLEKAISELADRIAASVTVQEAARS
ncbi:MAG TPA: hypothetical protein VME40_16615 [Caulobacteraceae bacterium]|nr:hypothetical protein [Caulobacteraceae bacterium]